jgi:hypothetical protein
LVRDPRILVVRLLRLPHSVEISRLLLLHDRLAGIASEGQVLSLSLILGTSALSFKILISNVSIYIFLVIIYQITIIMNTTSYLTEHFVGREEDY